MKPGGNRRRDTAPDKHINANHFSAKDLTDITADRRAEMHQRAVLPDRRAAAHGNECGYGRSDASLDVNFIIQAVCAKNTVGWPVPSHNAKQTPDTPQ